MTPWPLAVETRNGLLKPTSETPRQLLSFACQYRRNGLQQNPAVEQHAPLLDVDKIQQHANLKRRICARQDLPKSGDARLYFEALAMFRTVTNAVFYRMWARSDQAHVASQNVPQLRQFVETVLAKKSAERCEPRIAGDLEERPATLVLMTQRFLETVRSGDHRAEFVAIKWTTALAQAPRAINHRSTRPELDCHRDDQHDRPEEGQENRGQKNVHSRL
jgi:hypothetical protein